VVSAPNPVSRVFAGDLGCNPNATRVTDSGHIENTSTLRTIDARGVDVQVSVLGPVRARRNGDDVRLGPRLQRLLAALVVHRGSIVSSDTLADIVWEGTPPAGAEGTLRTYVCDG